MLGARNAGKDPNETDNWRCQFGTCSYPRPDIPAPFFIPITLFESCDAYWIRNDFDGSRQFLDSQWLRIQSEALGVPLDESTLDVLSICQTVIREQDAEAAAARQPKK